MDAIPLIPLVLTAAEAAAMLNVPPVTLVNLHRIGALRGVLVGRHLRWKPADVAAFVESLEPGR